MAETPVRQLTQIIPLEELASFSFAVSATSGPIRINNDRPICVITRQPDDSLLQGFLRAQFTARSDVQNPSTPTINGLFASETLTEFTYAQDLLVDVYAREVNTSRRFPIGNTTAEVRFIYDTQTLKEVIIPQIIVDLNEAVLNNTDNPIEILLLVKPKINSGRLLDNVILSTEGQQLVEFTTSDYLVDFSYLEVTYGLDAPDVPIELPPPPPLVRNPAVDPPGMFRAQSIRQMYTIDPDWDTDVLDTTFLVGVPYNEQRVSYAINSLCQFNNLVIDLKLPAHIISDVSFPRILEPNDGFIFSLTQNENYLEVTDPTDVVESIVLTIRPQAGFEGPVYVIPPPVEVVESPIPVPVDTIDSRLLSNQQTIEELTQQILRLQQQLANSNETASNLSGRLALVQSQLAIAQSAALQGTVDAQVFDQLNGIIAELNGSLTDQQRQTANQTSQLSNRIAQLESELGNTRANLAVAQAENRRLNEIINPPKKRKKFLGIF